MGLKEHSLIVSCQALEEEPLHSSFIMSKMALAAKMGGAKGIRANTCEDIRAIQAEVALPIIGIIKKNYGDHPIYITPTMTEIKALVETKVDVIAMDATQSIRPDGLSLDELFANCKTLYPEQKWMADCSTLEEMQHAAKLGFDYIGTTLVGYTEQSKNIKIAADDFILIRQALKTIQTPIICEGNIDTPEKATRVLELGCYCVVVGGAITRPQLITKKFYERIEATK